MEVLASRQLKTAHRIGRSRGALGRGCWRWRGIARSTTCVRAADAHRGTLWKQARDFLREAAQDRYHLLFAVALTTGIQPSEYLALKWPDVNFSKGTVSIARTLESIKGGGWRFADTKRARSRRLVKLQASVVKLLADYRDVQARERDAGNGDVAAADLIYVNSRGNPLNERNLVQRNFQVILERGKLPRIRLYDLRHKAATLALGAGVPAKVVSEQLGHANVAFTLGTYSHVLPHMQEAAAAQVEALLFESSPKKRASRKKSRATIGLV